MKTTNQIKKIALSILALGMVVSSVPVNSVNAQTKESDNYVRDNLQQSVAQKVRVYAAQNWGVPANARLTRMENIKCGEILYYSCPSPQQRIRLTTLENQDQRWIFASQYNGNNIDLNQRVNKRLIGVRLPQELVRNIKSITSTNGFYTGNLRENQVLIKQVQAMTWNNSCLELANPGEYDLYFDFAAFLL